MSEDWERPGCWTVLAYAVGAILIAAANAVEDGGMNAPGWIESMDLGARYASAAAALYRAVERMKAGEAELDALPQAEQVALAAELADE